MPWTLELPVLWNHPVERMDLVKAYPEFVNYVQSEGQIAVDWYQRPFSEQDIINNQ